MNSNLASPLRFGMGLLMFLVSLLCAPFLLAFAVTGATVSIAPAVFYSVASAVLGVSLATLGHLRRKLAIWVAVVGPCLWIVAFLLGRTHDWSHREPWFSILLAALGIAGVTLWFIPRDGRIVRQRLWAGGFLLAFWSLFGASLYDWPAWPDATPEPLVRATGGKPGAIERFHCYDLGGFIDHDWLWRIDARSDVLQSIAPSVGLEKVDSVPPGFWEMPPYYWPRNLPPGAQLYSTPGFSHGAGEQYFMLIDARHRLAVVWVKSLFG
jgi:hypothetical protein